MASRIPFLILLATATPLAAQTRDHAPTALPSAAELNQDKPKSESWSYTKPGLNLGRYQSIRILPTTVYRGADAQFEKISEADRNQYASVMTDALRSELGKSFTLVDKPGPGVLSVKLTLLGVERTQGGVATVSRVLPIGLVTSAIKSAAGKKGTMSGSLLFAVELTDSASGELEAAAVRRRAPDALDIKSTVSTTETAKAVAGDLAETLRKKLETAMGRTAARG